MRGLKTAQEKDPAPMSTGIQPGSNGGAVTIFPTNCFAGSPFAAFLLDLDYTLVDIGMRGGAEPDLLPIAFATDVIGFEPEPVAYRALAASGPGRWKSQQVFQTAIARNQSTVRLHVTDDPQSSSLLEPDGRLGEAYGKQQFFDVDHTIEVAAASLDAALEEHGARPPGFLKLDVEGLEAEILDGAASTLEQVAMIKIEIAMLAFNKGQPVFREIDARLAASGFRLFDLLTLHRWRLAGHISYPHLAGGPYTFARGSLMHGDALYIRDVLPGGRDAADHALAYRAVAGLLAYGYFDHALAILEQPDLRRHMEQEYRMDPAAAVKIISRKFGAAAWRRAFRDHLRGLGGLAKSGIRGLRR